jgi:ankyrin
MVYRLIQFFLALAVLVGSVLYFEGYIQDRKDQSTGDRICRRPPDEVEAWYGRHAMRRPEQLQRIERWAREHPDRVNRGYGPACSTALHSAAEFGREDVARILLARGADVDAHDEYGQTPLHRAAAYGNLDLVRLLMDRGADVDAWTDGGSTPLHKVVQLSFASSIEARLDVARALLDAGADPNAPERSSHFTPLRFAVGPQGDPALARLLLERGARLDATDAQGGTVLHAAAFQGDLQTVHFVIDGGADIDAADLQTTSLGYAAMGGHVEVVGLLLERGADPNRSGSTSRLPWSGIPLEMALLPAGAADHTVGRRLEIATLLVENGADVDVRGLGGRTFLHGAAEEGNLASAKFLLDHGAKVDAADSLGFTPLHAAVENAHLELAELLLSGGADANAIAADGTTPLALARVDPEMEALMRRHGGR